MCSIHAIYDQFWSNNHWWVKWKSWLDHDRIFWLGYVPNQWRTSEIQISASDKFMNEMRLYVVCIHICLLNTFKNKFNEFSNFFLFSQQSWIAYAKPINGCCYKVTKKKIICVNNSIPYQKSMMMNKKKIVSIFFFFFGSFGYTFRESYIYIHIRKLRWTQKWSGTQPYALQIIRVFVN